MFLLLRNGRPISNCYFRLCMSITTLEERVIHNNVDCGLIISQHLMSGIALKSFLPAKSKIHQDWTIICWCNEAGDSIQWRKNYSLEMYGARDYLDALPHWTLFITCSHLLFYFVLLTHLIYFHNIYRLQMALQV